MIKCRPNSSSNRIRQTQLRANVSEKPGRKTATERFIEHFYGIVIWIPARSPKFHHANRALVHIFFGNQIIAGLCRMEFDFWLLKRRAFWPGAECLPKFSFHLRRIEIPRDAQNDVVGVNMRMMPVDQILASDRGNRCVLRNTRIRILRAVRQLGGFAHRDTADVVIAPRNGIESLSLSEINLVFAELRFAQQFGENFENVIKIRF